jgi:hypothetical protein
MVEYDDLYNACHNYVTVYDAAARILNDKPADHISAADVWRLRAAYIDALAANVHYQTSTTADDLDATRAALAAATTGHTMT